MSAENVICLPASWSDRTGDAVISAYTMVGCSEAELSRKYAVDLGDTCIVAGNMTLPRLKVLREFGRTEDGNLNVTVRSDPDREEQPLLLVVSAVDDVRGVQHAEDRVSEVVALVSLVLGQRIVHEHVEDYRFSLDDGELSPTPTLILSLAEMRGARLGNEALNNLREVDDRIENSDNPSQVCLSLRWADKATRTYGTDGFLQMWIAVETLVMKKSGDLDSIKAALASIYGIEPQAADDEFCVTDIYVVRNNIAHDGARYEIPIELIDCLYGVYLDLLIYITGGEASHEARQRIQRLDGSLASLISITRA